MTIRSSLNINSFVFLSSMMLDGSLMFPYLVTKAGVKEYPFILINSILKKSRQFNGSLFAWI